MSTSQKQRFLDGEGDAYHERNRQHADREYDPVLDVIERMQLQPRSVLEIGCGDGRRLQRLRERLGSDCSCSGLDPSSVAVRDGMARDSSLKLRRGTADTMPYIDAEFDLVVFGFCLYLCDRADLFRIAAEADRVLKDRGHLVIYDFVPMQPYRNQYAHLPGVFSHKLDHAKCFTWNPAYSMAALQLSRTLPIDDRVGVTVLLKDSEAAYPDNPYTGSAP